MSAISSTQGLPPVSGILASESTVPNRPISPAPASVDPLDAELARRKQKEQQRLNETVIKQKMAPQKGPRPPKAKKEKVGLSKKEIFSLRVLLRQDKLKSVPSLQQEIMQIAMRKKSEEVICTSPNNRYLVSSYKKKTSI